MPNVPQIQNQFDRTQRPVDAAADQRSRPSAWIGQRTRSMTLNLHESTI